MQSHKTHNHTLIVFKDAKGNTVRPRYFAGEKRLEKINSRSALVIPYGARAPKEIPYDLIAKAESETLIGEDLNGLELAEVMRLGARCPFAAKLIWEHKHLRCPMPVHNDHVLFPHQWRTLQWMVECERIESWGTTGGIMALDPGLGKTKTAVFFSLMRPREEGPTLIVCSKTLSIIHWPYEIAKWFGPSAKVLVLTADALGAKLKEVTYEYVMAHDIVITTYSQCRGACTKGKYEEYVQIKAEEGLHKNKVIGLIQRNRDTLPAHPKSKGLTLVYEIPWTRVILDESQAIKNPKSKLFYAMLAIYGRWKWCLTGTMTMNEESDVWSQLFFCGYDGVQQVREWKKKYARLMELHNIRKRIMYVSYTDADIKMPELEQRLETLHFSANEAEIYSGILTMAHETLADFLSQRVSFSALLALITALRKSCICSFLGITKKGQLSGKQKAELHQLEGINKWAVNRSGEAGLNCTKFNYAVNLIHTSEEDDRFLVFCTFAEALKIFSERLDSEGITFEVLIGEMKHDDRADAVRKFKQNQAKVLLLTFKVGSEGLCLPEANKVIFLDEWWNDATSLQAMQRSWRLGQNRKVTVYKLLFERSLELLIKDLCADKRDLGEFFKTGKQMMGKRYSGLNKTNIERLLRTGMASKPKGTRGTHNDDSYEFFKRHWDNPRIYLDILEFKNHESPTMEQIEKRYRSLMRKYHPDKNPTAEAEEMSKRINEARDVLKKLYKHNK
jgi:SNF2 family DNA or RNA helicase